MLLAIDIGNTDTVVGVFYGDKLKNSFRVASKLNFTVDESGFFVTGLLERMGILPGDIDRVVMASVVPSLTPIFERMCHKYLECEPLVVSSKVKLPIKLGYDDPREMGADRIADAVAAFVKFGGPIIIVDYGTATTFNVVTADGLYVGGVIAPGVKTAGSGLAEKAARLFEVRIEKPDRIIGKTTAESIKSGLFYGTIGQVDSILELIINEIGQKTRIIATGGLSAEFAPYSKYIEDFYPELTLEGLKIIADRQ
jgi:type III pantothenate kinase